MQKIQSKEAVSVTYAELIAWIISQNQELIRENERLKQIIEKSAPAATEALNAKD